MRAMAIVLALSVAAIALAGCLRTGLSVDRNGGSIRTGVPISLL